MEQKKRKYKILTNNGVHIDTIESDQSLTTILRNMQGGWLLFQNVIINTRIIDSIVELPNE